MTMPRPSGKAQKIAEQVVPGLQKLKASKPTEGHINDGSLSEVEIIQTNNIENRKGLKR
jgi:hypothetical protein